MSVATPKGWPKPSDPEQAKDFYREWSAWAEARSGRSYLGKPLKFSLDKLREGIEHAAARERLVTYGELMDRYGLSHAKYGDIGTVLGIVSEYTWVCDGIWLSAIVVTSDSLSEDQKTGYPGGGFLGLNETPDEVARDGDYGRRLSEKEKQFIRAEQQRVFEWAKKGTRMKPASGP
jgi:hypothetical protein